MSTWSDVAQVGDAFTSLWLSLEEPLAESDGADEFGIRLALGGSAAGVMITVARRALVQIAVGLVWGAGMWVGLMSWALTATPGSEAEKMRAPWPYVLAAASAVVIAVALAAALGPTLRYVRMRPIETLRVDG